MNDKFLLTNYCDNAKHLGVMSAKHYTNDKLELQIPALQYGALAIRAAQAGIDISTLLTREALARQGWNNVPVSALPPVPPPVPVSCPAPAMFPTPSPVVVNGADPDLNLR